MILVDNLKQVRSDVEQCGRDVVLVAACKMQTKQTVDDFMALAPDFVLGENRVQELLEKYDARYEWHFIGQLQTNKVKYIIDKVSLIHSVDRLELAKEIDRQAKKHGKIQRCLVEVNMAAEVGKGGVLPDAAIDFIKSLAQFENIEIAGLMSVLPNLGDTPELHAYCDGLQVLFEKTKSLSQKNVRIKYLSAGMSGDYKIALQHGANMIRLGRALFGQRPMQLK